MHGNSLRFSIEGFYSWQLEAVSLKTFSGLLIHVCHSVVLQEAVSTGDPEMVQLVLQCRDYIKASTALEGVPELLSKIREVLLLFSHHIFLVIFERFR